jgi:hypothetical protein
MKKWLLIFGIIAILGSIYILIPAKLTISQIVTSKCSITAADRYFLDTSQWRKWWPKDLDCRYKITGVLYNQVHVQLQNKGDLTLSVTLRIAQLHKDSVLFGDECLVSANRLTIYRQAKEIRENMIAILSAFKKFSEDQRNIYGVNIEHTFSKDSILVTLSGYTAAYPMTDYIYRLIDSVKQYVNDQGAAAIDPSPLLNIEKLADSRFRTMVAFSVNKQLTGTRRIIVKRFVPWKMIEAEVHGGVYTVDRAMEQLFKYRDDKLLSIMSIPFQTLITDRRKEQDTTKWVTKVSAPIS